MKGYGGASNTAIARFSLAVDRRFKRDGQPDADFFNCTAFGKTGEFVEKYLRKGTKVVVDGEMQNDNYQNKEGQMVYGFQVVVNSVEFAESKAAASGNTGNTGNGFAQPQQNAGRPTPEAAADGFMNITDGVEDEGLPFN